MKPISLRHLSSHVEGAIWGVCTGNAQLAGWFIVMRKGLHPRGGSAFNGDLCSLNPQLDLGPRSQGFLKRDFYPEAGSLFWQGRICAQRGAQILWLDHTCFSYFWFRLWKLSDNYRTRSTLKYLNTIKTWPCAVVVHHSTLNWSLLVLCMHIAWSSLQCWSSWL